MKRALLIAAMLLAGAASAHADQFETTYHDLIRPHGKPRSDAVFNAALDACYRQTGEDRTLADTPAFRQCMLKGGYRFQSQRLVGAEPAPPLPPPGAIGVYTYNDMLGRSGAAGGEAAEQAATHACDHGAAERIGTPAFNACMAARGWRFASFSPAPEDEDSSPAEAEEVSSPGPDLPDIGAMERDNQLRDDAATAASQAQLNAANIAAATQP
jgi:hypothetical protein